MLIATQRASTTRLATGSIAKLTPHAASSSAMPRRTKPSSTASPSPSPSIPSHTDAILFPTSKSFKVWMHKNHASTTQGIWLRLSKKSAPEPSVTYDEALDIALCYGWIDGQRKSLIDPGTHFAQRFTPRRKGSTWSKRNVDKVAVLEADGRMHPSGRAEVEAAKADGRWERAYSGAKDIQVPKEFEKALKEKGGWEFFEGLGKTQRYSFLMRLQTIKTDATRMKKIEQFAEMLAEGKTL